MNRHTLHRGQLRLVHRGVRRYWYKCEKPVWRSKQRSVRGEGQKNAKGSCLPCCKVMAWNGCGNLLKWIQAVTCCTGWKWRRRGWWMIFETRRTRSQLLEELWVVPITNWVSFSPLLPFLASGAIVNPQPVRQSLWSGFPAELWLKEFSRKESALWRAPALLLPSARGCASNCTRVEHALSFWGRCRWNESPC